MEPMKPMQPMAPMKPMEPMKPMQPMEGDWWPQALGKASSTGSQNDLHYAYFDDAHRLAVKEGSSVKVYDTGPRRINGFAQQQGDGGSLSFSTDDGTVSLQDLTQVNAA